MSYLNILWNNINWNTCEAVGINLDGGLKYHPPRDKSKSKKIKGKSIMFSKEEYF